MYENSVERIYTNIMPLLCPKPNSESRSLLKLCPSNKGLLLFSPVFLCECLGCLLVYDAMKDWEWNVIDILQMATIHLNKNTSKKNGPKFWYNEVPKKYGIIVPQPYLGFILFL